MMIDLSSLPPLSEVIRHYQLTANRRFGQHFLLDMQITDKIVRAASPLTEAQVLEIGPGPGALTRSLLNAGVKHLTVIEKDQRFIPVLNEVKELSKGNLTVIEGDAMAFSPSSLPEPPYHIIANLPYNIATALLTEWLKPQSGVASMTVMIQTEVAERLCATPSTKAYGRLSVFAQLLSELTPLFTLPPQVFTPPPKVDSTVIRIVPHPPEITANLPLKEIETLTRIAFSARRKMIRKAIGTLNCDVPQLLKLAKIDETRRPETLTPQDYVTLAKSLNQIQKEGYC